MKQCLTILGCFATVLLFLTPRLSAQTEPRVYRIRTADVQIVDERLRNRFAADHSATFSIRRDSEPGIYRLCVLANEQTQSQIPEALQDYAQLLPQAENNGKIGRAHV